MASEARQSLAMGSGDVLRRESRDVDRSEIGLIMIGGSESLPCSKSLRAWAKSRFEQWRLHSEQRSDQPLKWSQKTSKFSAAQVIA